MVYAKIVGQLSVAEAVYIFVSHYLAYGVLLAIYRVSLHPLSKYPGPRLAAATRWYEFYFDIIKRGRFAWEIKRMHEVYGPVVRITPDELHVSEPAFYDELYAGTSRKRDKYAWAYNLSLVEGSSWTTIDHTLHRNRRAAVAPFFNLTAIRQFDPVIRAKLELLSQKFEKCRQSGEVVGMDEAYTAAMTDIVTQYGFGMSHGFLEGDGFAPGWHDLLRGTSEQTHLTKQLPGLVRFARIFPVSWLLKLKPQMAYAIKFAQNARASLDKAVSDHKTNTNTDTAYPTVFHKLLQSDLPAVEREPQRLLAEGIHARPLPPFNDLTKLPYFDAVINEGFRLSHGIISRLPRVAPTEDLHVPNTSITIPAGTPIGMSSWLVHMNPSLFPFPDDFRPERWLEPGAEQLKKYLVNFSKGSRICLGKDLARAEIVYSLALLVRRWAGDKGLGMRLFETERGDVEIERDFFNPYSEFGKKGVRVVFK